MNMKQVTACVHAELRSNEAARKNDNALIIGVLHRLGIDTSVPFDQLVMNPHRPNFESITRARRKVQEEFPELRDLATASRRKMNAEAYEAYARNKRRNIQERQVTINDVPLTERRYSTALGYTTEWRHPNGVISKKDGDTSFTIVHFVKGMDGNDHRVFWHTSTLVAAVEYLNKQGDQE